jgi:hypothetical protein
MQPGLSRACSVKGSNTGLILLVKLLSPHRTFVANEAPVRICCSPSNAGLFSKDVVKKCKDCDCEDLTFELFADFYINQNLHAFTEGLTRCDVELDDIFESWPMVDRDEIKYFELTEYLIDHFNP